MAGHKSLLMVAYWCRVRRGNLERLGNLERPSTSSVNSELQVQFLASNISVNWAFSSGKYSWAA